MTHPRVPEITVLQAAARARSGEALLVDVREPHEWARGHAADATHLAMSVLRPEDLPRDRPVMVICHLGGRSAMVAGHLLEAGLQVSNVTGGMDAWEAAGLPVVR